MKRLMKILSLVLCIVMVVSSLPISALAASKKDIKEEKAETVTVSELKDKRDIYSKIYETSKGTNVIVSSAVPLHYEKDGKLVEIDNTLVKSEKDDSVLTNKSNSFNVELPKKMTADSEISLNDEISFKLVNDDISRSKGTISKNEEIKIDETNSENVAYKESNMDSLSSSIEYKNVLDKTDLEYTISNNQLKENIVINELPTEDYSVNYELNIGKMKAELNNDNSITIFNKKDEPEYVIEKPYMFDSCENESDDVKVSLVEQEGLYLLTYVPSFEWLSNENIKFPVTVDPTITITGSHTISSDPNNPISRQYIEDNYVGSRLSTNMFSASQLKVSNGNNKFWTYYNINRLPALPSNAKILNFKLNLNIITKPNSSFDIGLYSLDSINSISTNDDPTINNDAFVHNVIGMNYDAESGDKLVDVVQVTNSKTSVFFDLTNISNDVFNNTNNNFILKALNGSATVSIASSEAASEKIPYITTEYNIINGISNDYNFHTNSIGLAGEAYINDYNGSLIVKRTDFKSGTNEGITFYMGKGVNAPSSNCFGENTSINYYQTLEVSPFEDSDYILTYGDGSKKYLNSSVEAYSIEESSADGENYIHIKYYEGDNYIDKGFQEIDSTYYLISISEIKNDKKTATIDDTTHELTHNSSAHLTSIGYLGDSIDYIETDTAYYQFEQGDDYYICTNYSNISSGNVSTTQGNTMEARYNKYSYSEQDNKLTVILGADNGSDIDDPSSAYGTETITYEYDSTDNITKIIDEHGRYFSYSYNNGKVINAKEYSQNNDEGKQISFNYNDNSTVITDEESIYTEFFDLDGNVLEIIDQDGNAVFSQYSDNILTKKSKTRNSARNIINYYNFESPADTFFNTQSGTVNMSSAYKLNGNSSVKLTCPASVAATYSGSITGLKSDTTYTVSMWIKKAVDDTNCSLRLANNDNVGIFVTSNTSETTDWQQISCTIDTENSTQLNVSVAVDNSLGESSKDVYVDFMYIQQSPYLTNVNILNNGDFSNTLNNWNSSGTSSIESIEENIATKDNYRLKMAGTYNSNNCVSQVVSVNAPQGTKFSYGVWLKSVNALPNNENRDFCISIYASDGSNQEELIDKTSFSTNYTNWQYIENEFTLGFDIGGVNDTYSHLKYVISYNNQAGFAFVDGAFLSKDELYSVEFDYNLSNEIIGISPHETIINESDSNNSPLGDYQTEIEYDSFGNEIEIDKSVTTGQGSNEIVKHIIKQFEYSNNGSLLTKNVSRFTNYSNYKYDYFGNVSYKNDENGKIIQYEYDNFQNLSNIIDGFCSDGYTDDITKYNDLMGTNYNGSEPLPPNHRIDIKYTYNGSRLEKIETIGNNANGSNANCINIYEFTYDDWGNLTNIFINDTDHIEPFIQYTYDNDNYRQLNNISYINEQEINYLYDSKGNIIYKHDTSSSDGSTMAYSYYYYDDGTCYAKKDLINGFIESYQDGCTTIIGSNGNIIYSFGNNSDNNRVEQIGPNFVETEKDASTQTTTVNGDEYTVTRTYDDFGRLASEKYQKGNCYPYILKEYFYYAHGGEDYSEELVSGSTSGSIETTDLYRFVNISLVDQSENKTLINHYSYMYYLKGDLCVRNPNSNPQTYIYNNANMVLSGGDFLEGSYNEIEYNAHGNLSFIKSSYATGTTLNTYHRYSVKNIRFAYDGANSGTKINNRLTQFNIYDVNESTSTETLTDTYNVLYDSLGNTDSISGTNKTIDFEWCRGNVLNQSEISETIDNSTVTTDIDYKYDDNNLRTNKTVSYDSNDYLHIDYIWNNKKLMGAQIDFNRTNVSYSGKYNTIILYDQDDNAYGFIVNKTENASGVPVNESQTFYYVKDSSNMITDIVCQNGTIGAKFKYEVFGNPHKTTYNVDYLRIVNPFIYHDNIYDEETNMYYMQSRYYMPQIGRYISADSKLDNGTNTIMATNLYAYCENDPINNTICVK